MRIHVWAENMPLEIHGKEMRRIYPDGIEGALAAFLSKEDGFDVTVSRGTDPGFGLSPETIDKTDVLVYWSHKHWRDIPDEAVERIQAMVLDGMGLVLLHSAHASKIFSRLVGTKTQALEWHEDGEKQRVVCTMPSHEIAKGLPRSFTIDSDESYGEYFDIPQPDELVFITVSESMDALRSGCCFRRGKGRIFYFSSGHETFPVYYQREVQTVISNAVRWAAPKHADWPVMTIEKRRNDA